MGLHDRDYSRERDGGGSGFGGGAGRGLLGLLFSSFPIGTYLGIRVQVHFTFALLVVIELITASAKRASVPYTLLWISLLFLSVLLHEFGHCLACRRVGGSADEIIMWPLGGLALCRPPRRPWPEFVTVAGGPLVTLLLALVPYLALLIWFGRDTPVTLDPTVRILYLPQSAVAELLALLFAVNWILLLFNLLLIFYPFDGGRLVQIALWTKLGYRRSMNLACIFGMAGAVVVGLYALVIQEILVVFICIFGFYTCYQQKQMLRWSGAEDALDEAREAWQTQQQPQRPGWRERRARRQQQRAEESRQRLDAEMNRILDKVHREGLGALSAREKRTLREGTEQRRRTR